jgi:hypothetical protein
VVSDYAQLTGFRLKLTPRGTTITSTNGDSNADSQISDAVETPRAAPSWEPPNIPPLPPGGKLEINAAYAVILSALRPYGLYKAGLKGGSIVLTFISPQVAARHLDKFELLTKQTGYPLTIHPHPNQQEILQVANRLIARAGWQIRKGPGIHTDRAEVAITLATPLDESTLAQISTEFEEQTGYKFAVSQ